MKYRPSALLYSSNQKWFERFFRFGLFAKGTVYCLIGVLAVVAAVGLSREKVSKTEIFTFIYEKPFGQVMLAVITLGLFGYVMLRFFQAFRDTDKKGNDAKGIFSRLGYGVSGLIYLSLGLYAGKLLFQGKVGDGNSREFILSKILAWEWGEWIVGITGLIIVGSGVYQIFRGVTGKFMKKINVAGAEVKKVVKKAGHIGYISRGAVLVIIGYLVFHAAINSNPNGAQGTEGAFQFIEYKFGGVLMAIIALGLVGYGVFMFVKAKYEKINVNL